MVLRLLQVFLSLLPQVLVDHARERRGIDLDPAALGFEHLVHELVQLLSLHRVASLDGGYQSPSEGHRPAYVRSGVGGHGVFPADSGSASSIVDTRCSRSVSTANVSSAEPVLTPRRSAMCLTRRNVSVDSCSASRSTWRSRCARRSDWRAISFWLIRIQIDRKMASNETTMVSRLNGKGSNGRSRRSQPVSIAIQLANQTR